MKLSDAPVLGRLVTDRQRLVCLLNDIEHGADAQASIGGWDVDVPAEMLAALTETAKANAEAELAECEKAIEALGVTLDVPRSRYVLSSYGCGECDCADCEAERESLADDEPDPEAVCQVTA